MVWTAPPQWFDDSGRMLYYSTWRRVRAGPNMKRHAMASTAPAAARSALVWLIAVQGGDVDFDNTRFYELR